MTTTPWPWTLLLGLRRRVPLSQSVVHVVGNAVLTGLQWVARNAQGQEPHSAEQLMS